MAKATWVSVGDHPYTGMFRSGGDAGYVRLSSIFQVDKERQHMSPGIGIKLLRDGVDSADLVATYSFDGQQSLNFFEHSMTSNIDPVLTPIVLQGLAHFAVETDFVWSMGLSSFATHTQDGTKEEQPVFPWNLRFEPVASYANPVEDPAQFDL